VRGEWGGVLFRGGSCEEGEMREDILNNLCFLIQYHF
jgi:hypothetical protein